MPDGAVSWSAEGTAAFTGAVNRYGSVSWSADGAATITGDNWARQTGSVSWSAETTWSVTAGPLTTLNRITWGANSTAVFDSEIITSVAAVPGLTREPYILRARLIDGTPVGEFSDALLGTATWQLNGVHTFNFSIPIKGTGHDIIPIGGVPTHEIELWRGRQLLFQGPVTRAMGTKDNVTYDASSSEWYFTKRYVGKANRTNQVLNPSFEDQTKYWSYGWNPIAYPVNLTGVTMTVVNSPVYDGTRSLRITASNIQPSGYMSQYFPWTVPPGEEVGELWTFVVWFYISSYTGPGFNNDGGLTLARYSTTETVDIYTPVVGQTVTYPKPLSGGGRITFDSQTTRNKWVRAEIPMLQIPHSGETDLIQIQLQAIKGTVYWDNASLTRNERLDFNNVDQALIAKGLVEHGQSIAYGKSSLNIGTNCQLTGVKRSREYEHSAHALISDSLDEFPTLANGFDHNIEITPTSRTYTTYFPYKGLQKKKIILEYGRNLVDFSVSSDGQAVANSVVILGDGEGSDREEGGYIDSNALNGLILEKVYNSTPGAPLNTLNEQAQRGVERYKNPVVIPEVTTHELANDLIGRLAPGDVVRVKIDYGWISVDEDYRIIQIALDPRLDQLKLTINPVSEEVLTKLPVSAP